MNFISQNLGRPLSLKEIAGRAFFSMFHFHRIFKAVAGETVSDFTRRLRLETAANWLVTNDDAITGIAMDCGFSSSQNLAKAFKRHFGMSPSAYRKRKNGNNNSKKENALSLRACYDINNRCARYFEKKERKKIMAEVKEMPEFNVAYVRTMGAYGNEPCAEAFRALAQWARPRGYLATGKMMSVYWDNPEVTAPENCRADACLSVPAGTAPDRRVGLQAISGGPYLACYFAVKPSGFVAAWEDAFAWLVARGYECADLPCYELYRNYPANHSKNKWKIEIYIPLKRK
ncbi:MAG: GyrI-like domain-containing protein [Kiritimatiellia bacterium]